MNDEIKGQLEAFVLGNRDLERLDTILNEYNPFEAIGWTRQELRHSAFLRWILDPKETHGLGPYFLRLFLKAAVSMRPDLDAPSVVDLDSWSYSATLVQTEWRNIDLVIHDDELKFVCVVENKVDSREHSQQLQRYRGLIQDAYPGYQAIFIYLTIGGEEASDPGYIPMNYGNVIELLHSTLSGRRHQLIPEVNEFITSYIKMVRRNIMEDSEIQKLCQKIYQTHRKALDVLFENRLDQRGEVRDYLTSLIEKHPDLVSDHCTKASIRFLPKKWDVIPRAGRDWVPSNRMVLCEVNQSPNWGVWVKVLIGPGNEKLRAQLVERVQKSKSRLNRINTKVYPQYWSFHNDEWVTKKIYEGDDKDRIKSEIDKGFQTLVDQLNDLATLFDGIE